MKPTAFTLMAWCAAMVKVAGCEPISPPRCFFLSLKARFGKEEEILSLLNLYHNVLRGWTDV